MVATVQELERHRAALTGHCYRMLGSAVDADDAVQETIVRAWKGLERFDGRSSLRTWLYRIATHVCFDALSSRQRRELPVYAGPHGSIDDALETRPRQHWLEPIPEARVLPSDADPAERAALRQSIRLAFVAAVQHLPPKQRAALLFADVLGCSAAEIADCLDTSVASVTSALQRARATLQARDLGDGSVELDEAQKDLVDRYCAAFERYDVDAITALMRGDAKLSMPPYTLWIVGREAIGGWLLGPGAACRGSRLVRVEASATPAFAQFRRHANGGYYAWALVTLTLAQDRIAEVTAFLDSESLFPRFGLPLRLD